MWCDPPALAKRMSSPPVGSHGERHRCRDLILDGDIGDDRANRTSVADDRRDLGDGLGQLLLRAPTDRNMGAVGGQTGRGCQPDAAAAAGDERRAVPDRHHATFIVS